MQTQNLYRGKQKPSTAFPVFLEYIYFLFWNELNGKFNFSSMKSIKNKKISFFVSFVEENDTRPIWNTLWPPRAC